MQIKEGEILRSWRILRVRARLKSGSMATKSLSDAASTPSSAVSITSIAVTTGVMANGRRTPRRMNQ